MNGGIFRPDVPGPNAPLQPPNYLMGADPPPTRPAPLAEQVDDREPPTANFTRVIPQESLTRLGVVGVSGSARSGAGRNSDPESTGSRPNDDVEPSAPPPATGSGGNRPPIPPGGDGPTTPEGEPGDPDEPDDPLRPPPSSRDLGDLMKHLTGPEHQTAVDLPQAERQQFCGDIEDVAKGEGSTTVHPSEGVTYHMRKIPEETLSRYGIRHSVDVGFMHFDGPRAGELPVQDIYGIRKLSEAPEVVDEKTIFFVHSPDGPEVEVEEHATLQRGARLTDSRLFTAAELRRIHQAIKELQNPQP